MSWSYPFPERMMSYLVAEKENLPLGELALGQEAQVHASNGWIGKVDVFLVEKNTRLLSGLVMQRGHLFWVKEQFLPIRVIERIEKGKVYLKFDPKNLESFPSIPKRYFLRQTEHNSPENWFQPMNN